MKLEGWYLLLGTLMLGVTFLDQLVKRLPITTTIVYLAVGFAIGPLGFELLKVDPIKESKFLESVTEIAVTISLFTAGLKLRVIFTERWWQLPIRLAFVSMSLTVGMIAIFGFTFLELPLGAAILLGAILAPTDPVLASDVQLEHPDDRDRLRFSLTGEAGLNDGTAFPFVMMGLGLLGARALGIGGSRWLAMDLIWAVAGGLALGGLLGTIVGKLVGYLQEKRKETLGRDEFLCLGLITFSYGAALILETYGFLTVFAAGVAFQRIHWRCKPSKANQSKMSPASIASPVLSANEQLERIFEAALVLMLGAMLSRSYLTSEALVLAVVLFFIVRPISVFAGCYRTKATGIQKRLLSWFGIRGIGSLYYLMYALQHGLPADQAERLTGLILSVVTISILVHGVSVTPLMNLYDRRKAKAPQASPTAES